MILILGGTTEGRTAVQTLEKAGKEYFYSTKGNMQEVECRQGIRIDGGMDTDRMQAFCRENNIRLLIDAAHPFAAGLHQTVAQTAQALNIPSIRFERQYPQPEYDNIVWCMSYDEATERIKAAGHRRILALTGVQTISKLRPLWTDDSCTCFFRVLHREESVQEAVRQGFPESRLIYYCLEKEPEANAAFAEINPDAIITKESGTSGGFEEKLQAAHRLRIPVYVIRRPSLPAYSETVTGPHGLRRAIEKLLPTFYPLRSGFTTGSCATAAAKAALQILLGVPAGDLCSITLPDGENISIPVFKAALSPDGKSATASVIKDAGDDPDITNGCEIGATVSFSSDEGIHFLKGEGVGTVTLPGLGISIGEPAINATPRKMISRELHSLYQGGIDVTVFIPSGRELAKRTFNPKLGIVDGLSVLGTSGIVQPFSNEAFVNSIRREIEVCKAMNTGRLVINSGAKSERYVKQLYPELPPQAFVHYGNFIGRTLEIAHETGLRCVTLGIMIGKAVKLAEGHLDTHSKKVVMNKDFLKALARDAGCSSAAIEVIGQITLARELWTGLSAEDSSLFFNALTERCYRYTAPLLPDGELTLLLIDEEGNIRYRI